MSTIATTQRLTPEEYLAIEEASEEKSEYYDGEMFAMAGGSFTHSVLVASVNGQFYARLRGSPCLPLNSDMRVLVPATQLYTYPDISVVCGPPRFAAQSATTLINPSLIVEVLSPSTERYDRGAKFYHYQSIPTLRDYLLVAQDKCRIDHFFRHSELGQTGAWFYMVYDGPDAVLQISSLNIQIPLAEIYAGVELTPPLGEFSEEDKTPHPGPPRI